MKWIKDRFPKSKGMYAIRTLPITEIRSFNFAYFDGTGWVIPSQGGEKIAAYRGTPEWSTIDWGYDI